MRHEGCPSEPEPRKAARDWLETTGMDGAAGRRLKSRATINQDVAGGHEEQVRPRFADPHTPGHHP